MLVLSLRLPAERIRSTRLTGWKSNIDCESELPVRGPFVFYLAAQ